MKTREEIITSMCYTYRHDYGLDKAKADPTWIAGMTSDDRLHLREIMSQIYDNNIAPFVETLSELNNGTSVVVPKDKQHAEALVRMGMFYVDNYKEKK